MMHTIGLILFAVAHGYFAAWLAVWMLFNPKEPKYFRGRQLPFTPGLLPGSRCHLEIAVAESISAQLLRPDVLEAAAIKQGLPKLIRSTLPEHIEALGNDAPFLETISACVSSAFKDQLNIRNSTKNKCTDLVPPGHKIPFTDMFSSMLGGKVEEIIDSVCRSKTFVDAMKGAIKHLADDLRQDESDLSMKVEQMSGKILGTGLTALNIRGIIHEQLSALSNAQLEELVHKTAGRHLRDIKYVAALIGIIFGIFSALLFG